MLPHTKGERRIFQTINEQEEAIPDAHEYKYLVLTPLDHTYHQINSLELVSIRFTVVLGTKSQVVWSGQFGRNNQKVSNRHLQYV